ncbi:hypothetical protein MMC30_001414 [Trapelia coarctata]|nr:hypothetical protein [Trapelia coarctata]
MPPKPSNDDISRDALFMFHCLMNAKSKPEIDWAKVAEAMNLKNGPVASVRFRQILKKHGFENKWATGSTNGSATPAKTPVKRKHAQDGNSTSKRGKKAATTGDDDGDDKEIAAKKPKVNADHGANADAIPSADALVLAQFEALSGCVPVNEESNDEINVFMPLNGKNMEHVSQTQHFSSHIYTDLPSAEDEEVAKANAAINAYMKENDKSQQKTLMYMEMQREDEEAGASNFSV